MRLGKSLAMIRFLKVNADKLLPALILTPNNVKRTWGNELQADGFNDYLILDGDKDKRNENLKLNCDIVICNYESVIPLKKNIKTTDAKTGEIKIVKKKYAGVSVDTFPFKSIIIDESQRVSNISSGITKYLMKHFGHIQYKYLLSGLPAPENEMQYFSQFMLAHGHFMYYRNFWTFRASCYDKVGYDWVIKPGIKDQIYDTLHENAFIKSRNDAGLPNLKEYTRRYVKMSKEQETAYKSMLKKYQYKEVEATNDLSQLTYLQQLAGGIDISAPEKPWLGTGKFELIKALLEGEFRGDNILIWARYNAEAILCWKYLNLLGFTCALVHGETTDDEVESIRVGFNSKKIQIVVATIRKIATGQNWSGADTAIYISNEFSNDLRSQSEDRIYSVDKTYPLLIVDLLTEDTIDEHTVDMLVDKKIDSKFFLSSLYGEIRKMAAYAD